MSHLVSLLTHSSQRAFTGVLPSRQGRAHALLALHLLQVPNRHAVISSSNEPPQLASSPTPRTRCSPLCNRSPSCIAGAGIAVVGALAAFRLLPGRGAPEVATLKARARWGCPRAVPGTWSTMWASRRASAAPRQKWGPNPKLRCGLGRRSMRTSPESSPKTASSRLADAYTSRTGSPAAIATDPIRGSRRRSGQARRSGSEETTGGGPAALKCRPSRSRPLGPRRTRCP